MKRTTTYLCVLIAISFLVGCSLFGTSPKAPTGVERAVFNVITNYYSVPVIVRETNVVTQVQVQIVQHTNEVGATTWTTNSIVFVSTNTVTVTNTVAKEDYTLTPKTGTTQSATVAGTIANFVVPGTGGLITSGILAVLAAWAQLRSSKRQDVSAGLAQEIETMREFIKNLPSGTKYDQAITTFLQQHQVDSNISQQVLTILGSQVSNTEAKSAMGEINAALKIASGTP